jgi:predicted small secreted protein
MRKIVLAALLIVVSTTFTGCGGNMTSVGDHSQMMHHMSH